ncbi:MULTISPECIES: DEAD/DEAH box helicase family protein [unclassified Nitratiruptor]|uniref:restriction endonuclease n=1 Tax=unclassified Nitratiruptor TaxID=2624044 RepID=UPI0019161B68|nr:MULTISPECIES: DEAD/DEAH box helicase family protein [unclassified Nitratiruptor]BCD59335.1 type III restriction enzyme [Nitratiruptor sp. YY08-10]BCD63259.1 type III restriction enzyme [Nitratiruptor sp. YY08-14]
MKLHFKEQQYQIDAVNSVCDLFDGQPKKELIKNIFDKELKKDGLIEEEIIYNTFANPNLLISNEEILTNLKTIQKRNAIKPSKRLQGLNFTVEMETGTGKTYVYTRTIFELNKRYGFSKFIIMVPSVAIREGVHKSLEITQDHFKELYNKKLRFFIYDTKRPTNLSNIKSFAKSNDIWVMIMNYQAFATRAKEARKIYEELDLMNSNRPIDVIRSTRPILIIDEPQKFGKISEEKIKEFDPLFVLRYSATHKNVLNQVYKLDAIDAFEKKLVKKISVKGIEVKNTTATTGYLYLDEIILSDKYYPKARIEFEVKQQNGVKRVLKTLKEGDNFYELSNNLTEYKNGFVIKEINGLTNEVKLINGIVLKPGVAQGEVNEELLKRIQIRETIKSHFEKEQILFKRGIKVLSLFFIDEVKKYRDYDAPQAKGEYAKIFEEEYEKLKKEMQSLFNQDYFAYLDSFTTDEIHEGYFSIDKKGRLKDAKENDEDAYELIMKNKEKLLSFDTPVRFIFSHSALKEGWDNPNIFQICTLRYSRSTISKRQEIGRGLRICVDRNGYRMDKQVLGDEFFDINNLTVIANENYESFAKALQNEFFEDIDRPLTFTVENIKGLRLKDREIDEEMARKLVYNFIKHDYIDENFYLTDKLREDIKKGDLEIPSNLQEYKNEIIKLIQKIDASSVLKNVIEDEKAKNIKVESLKPNQNFTKFEEFWNKIKFKTTYRIDFDSNELIENVIGRINKELEVKKVKIEIVENEQKEKIRLDEDMFEAKKRVVLQSDIALNDIRYDLLGELSRATYLKRETIAKILQGINPSKFDLFKINPEDFIIKVRDIIEEEKATIFISAINYDVSGKFESEIFTINNFKGKIDEDIIKVKKHIYDYLKFDSQIEKAFAKDLEASDIIVYAKLPSKFKIPTPAGYYNPDFAILFKKQKTIFFIAETKGSLKSMELRGKEKAKIEYARKHFSYLSDRQTDNNSKLIYKVVNSIEDLDFI